LPYSNAGDNIPRAVVLMVVSTFMFGFMALTIRYASKQLHPFEIAFFRNLFGFVFTLPLLLRHGFGILRTQRISLYFMRCAMGIVSMLAAFWAIVNLPLAQATSLTYSTPLFVTIGAVFFLGEVVRARRWSAVALGFVGVLLIVQPGHASFNAGSLVALLAAAMSGMVAVSIKFLSRTEKPDTIVIYTTMLWVPMSLVPALFVWHAPAGITWLWIVLAGFFGTCGHMFWTRALKLADASLLTPVGFLQVPLLALFGYFLFGEMLDRWTAVGAAIIFASNAYIAHRESRTARRVVSDPEINAETPAPL
jgi:drug/metabolite transporter (DMT)-like permease